VALVKSFEKVGSSDRGRIHEEVRCGYASVDVDGQRYRQLDTYGSNERVIAGKVSQSIQLDRDGARRLKNFARANLSWHLNGHALVPHNLKKPRALLTRSRQGRPGAPT